MKRLLCPATALSLSLTFLLTGCEAKKSENPLAPTVAGPLAGVSITAPVLVEPAQGFRVKESQQPIKLVIENSTTTGVRPVSYSFEVATDSGFQTKVYARSGVPQAGGGRTSVTVDRLDLGRAYYWRVQADDGANQSTYSTASFEVLPKPFLEPPVPLTPVNDAAASRRPELKVQNSRRNEAIGFLVYGFQISSNASFTALVSAGFRDEGGGTTEYIPDADLPASTTFYWRSASTDGDSTSAWSGAQTFRTSGASPSPGPAPGPAPGGPCNSSNPQTIVQCERSKFGSLDENSVIQFLIQVADSLNRNNIPGGRFGLLRKDGGSQCNGYSCDIICSGNGGSQRQWDVLVDGGGATWNEVGGITVRVCEIR